MSRSPVRVRPQAPRKMTPPFGGVIFLGLGTDEKTSSKTCKASFGSKQLIIVCAARRESGHDLHGTKCLQIVWSRCSFEAFSRSLHANPPTADNRVFHALHLEIIHNVIVFTFPRLFSIFCALFLFLRKSFVNFTLGQKSTQFSKPGYFRHFSRFFE